METEIVPADPSMRRRLIAVVVIVVIASCGYFIYLFNEIERLSSVAEPNLDGLMQQLRWMSVALLAASTLLCVYLVLVAVRVFSSGRFPPPGTRVARATRVRTGGAARAIALAGALLGIGLVLLAMLVYSAIRQFIDTGSLL